MPFTLPVIGLPLVFPDVLTRVHTPLFSTDVLFRVGLEMTISVWLYLNLAVLPANALMDGVVLISGLKAADIAT